MDQLTLKYKMLVWLIQGLMEGIGFGIAMLLFIWLWDRVANTLRKEEHPLEK